MGACRAQTHKAKGRPSLHSKHCLETVVKELSKATINSSFPYNQADRKPWYQQGKVLGGMWGTGSQKASHHATAPFLLPQKICNTNTIMCKNKGMNKLNKEPFRKKPLGDLLSIIVQARGTCE